MMVYERHEQSVTKKQTRLHSLSMGETTEVENVCHKESYVVHCFQLCT